MKTALKISSILNIILAILAYMSQITPIYPLILVTFSIIYFTYQEQTITYLYNKKRNITIMSIINFILNPLSGITLLIGLDKLNQEYKEVEKKEKIKPLTKEEKQITLLLNLGVGLLILSGIILITTKINIITPTIKIIILLLMAILFLTLSLLTKYKLKIEILEKNYWLLSMLFIILTIIANGNSSVISTWFSFQGAGKNLYIAFTSIVIALLSQITDKKENNNLYKNISYIGIITSIFFILIQLNIPVEIALVALNITLLILNITLKKSITKYLIIMASIISTIGILDSNEIILQSILSLTTLINIITISIKGSTLEGIIAPIIVTAILLKTSHEIQETIKIENIETILLTITYAIIYMLNLLKIHNKALKITMNIITNIIFAILLIVTEDNRILLTLVSFTIAATSMINYTKNAIKSETILLPIKITILIINIIMLMQEIINPEYSLIIIYTMLFLTYIMSKNKIKKISKILYYITFIMAIIQNENQIIPAIINIIFSLLALIIIIKQNNTKHIKIAYIALLTTIAMTLLYTNILETTNIINSIILLLIYIILTLATAKEKTINKINYLAIILPMITISQDINITYEIQTIINTTIYLYLLLIINKFLLKQEKDKNTLTAILIPIIILNTMFVESWTIGLYVGIIALILIIIGTFKKEYKGILIEGIIITIINILYQFNYIIKELPLWIYTLITGLTLIGLVTYKITKNEKK